MQWMLLALQTATLGANNYGVDAPMAPPARSANFADEFAGKRVDQRRWRFDTSRNAAGWYNNEKQYYAADRPENTRIERGALVIEARREALSRAKFPDWGGQAYSSGKLVTRQSLGYGFYEVRAKLPCGRGAWPAIWMVGDDALWPQVGEIDIMEMVGWDPDVVHATLHSGAFNHRLGTQRGAQKRVATACTAFHRYQLDWRPDSITIGVDGRAYLRVANDQPGGKAAWPFTKPYPLILNLAIGGDWGGTKGIDDRAFPQRMTVDYVRYWNTATDRMPAGQSREGAAIGPAMGIIATIMNTTTGQPIQRMSFGRMPKPWASFTLETGELVTADRVEVGKPAPGKVVVPVSVWVTPKKK